MLQGRLFITLAACAGAALAAPANLKARTATLLSAADLSSLAPFTQFARAAYCPTDELSSWTCGEACAANSDFQPTLVGGDGNSIQIFFVGFSPSQNSIIVAHEGTDPTQLLSDLTDVDILKGNLDSTLFPGVPSTVEVHEGFRDEHAKTASQILQEVQRLMSAKNTNNIAVIGHSLGGALAELDSLFFTLNIPSASVQGVTYGTPRVGNPAYAQFFDQTVANFRHINNELDPIPIVPGRFMGFAHPHGEIHIISPGDAVACSGDDDTVDSQCTIDSVPNVIESDIIDHLGPYQGIFIGTIFCT